MGNEKIWRRDREGEEKAQQRRQGDKGEKRREMGCDTQKPSQMKKLFMLYGWYDLIDALCFLKSRLAAVFGGE